MLKKLNHILFIIIGPSGSGKTRVTEQVFPKEYKVISHTTRPIRQEETDGVDYYFESSESFQALIQQQKLVEYDQYNGYLYGVGIDTVIEKTNSHAAYNALTLNGFIEVDKLFGEQVVPIFFDVTKENVEERLKEREQDFMVIQKRLALYEHEIKVKKQLAEYKRLIVLNANAPLDQVVAEMKRSIRSYM